MKHIPTFLLALAASILFTPTTYADWGDWNSLVEDAKEKLGKTKDSLNEAAKSLEKNKHVSKAKDLWDSLQINERLRYAFGEDIDTKSALTGHFFDLKRPLPKAKDAEGRPLKAAKPGDVPAIIREFLQKGWDSSVLARYYSPKVKLLAPFFYLPRCKAEYAPMAFQCDAAENAKPVRPGCWIVLYQGVVKAPKSGTFRFVGMCDDTMIVRFNHKQVLESGWYIPTRSNGPEGTFASYQQEITTRAQNPAALYRYEETPHWNRHLGGLATGTVFEVKEGESYPIEILLSEIPGCEFGFALLVEEVKGEPKSGIYQPWESPKLHLFRTNATLPDEERIRKALGEYLVGEKMECPPFRSDSNVWKPDSDETEKAGFWERLLGESPEKDSQTAMGAQEKDEKKSTPATQKK